MSYYGSLSAAAAGAGGLIALLICERRPGWSVVALTAGAVPGSVLLVLGGIELVSVLGMANGAAGVFFFVLAGLLVLPLIEFALPTGRPRGLVVPPPQLRGGSRSRDDAADRHRARGRSLR
jgi:hypothetical protein